MGLDMTVEEPRARFRHMIPHSRPCWTPRSVERRESVASWRVHQVEAVRYHLHRRLDTAPIEQALARADQPHLVVVFVDRVRRLWHLRGHENEIDPRVVERRDCQVVHSVGLRMKEDRVVAVERQGLRRPIERPFVGCVGIAHLEYEGLVSFLPDRKSWIRLLRHLIVESHIRAQRPSSIIDIRL